MNLFFGFEHKYFMNLCQECNNSFSPKPGTRGIFCSLVCYGNHNGKVKSQKTMEKYYSSPKVCKQCSKIIDYRKRKTNIFCNASCAATYNNAYKDYTKIKVGPISKPKTSKINENIWGPHTRVYLCKCKITGLIWFSPTIKTIHPSCLKTKKLYSYQCRFTFSISKYPRWFNYASDLINIYGWYSAANRGNNLDGCSRDHLYSVTDGFLNQIDPKIISHPANCKIIPHKQNQNKHKNSSITLEELYKRILKFQEEYGEDNWNSTNLNDFADRCLKHSAISS